MSNLFRVSISFFYNVPFNKKDDAKKVRMQWSPKKKKWHIVCPDQTVCCV